MLLIGGRAYPLREHSAALLRDLISEVAAHERPLSYLGDAIGEDLAVGESPEPLELGTRQIAVLADLLWSTSDLKLQQLHAACERYLQPG